MNILMLTPFPGVRGPIPKHTPLLVDGLRQCGCTVSTEPWGRHADRDSIVQRAITRFRDVWRVRRRLRGEPFDLMVVKTSHEWPSLLRDLPLLAAARTSVPSIVLQFHGGRSDRLVAPGQFAFKAASAALLRMSDGVLVLSSEEQRQLREFYPRGRFHVVANPFAASSFLALNGGRRDGSQTVLFVSRLIAEKGIFETLDAVKLLRERVDLNLVVAGSGPEEQQVAQRVRDLGIFDHVTLAGYLSGHDLERAYHAASVFVLPTYWFEGFPTAITEAMAAGLPIVTTETRGIVDHLEEGTNAVFVPPRDAVALADALEALIADDELRERMSIANREKVKVFAPAAVAATYLDALAQIGMSRTSPPEHARGGSDDRS
jgi:glycosyltransferase involved in cell wall biosynthesis